MYLVPYNSKKEKKKKLKGQSNGETWKRKIKNFRRYPCDSGEYYVYEQCNTKNGVAKTF